MINIGPFDIIGIKTGTFRLDGGAMFGVVPKTMWGGHEDVDEHNRMLLATWTLAAASRDRKTVLLVDTGNGPKWSAEEAARFAIEHDGSAIENGLRRAFGLGEADVTDVIVTHLHFDHNGGLTEWSGEPGGPTRLRFSRARHWIHREHWAYRERPTEKDRASFFKRDYEILAGSDVLRLVDGDEPVAPWDGVKFIICHGHSPYQLLPVFHGGGRELIFTGDVIPTSSHLRVPWVMAYDLHPLITMDEKKRMYARCRENGAMLAFPHDHRFAAGRIDFAKDKPFVAEVLDLGVE